MSNIINTTSTNSNSEKKTRLLKPVVELLADNKTISVKVDTTGVTFETLKQVEASEKGNRTVLYEKWTNGGITYQLTGYVTEKAYGELENVEKTQEMARQVAKLQAMEDLLANDPEMQALYAKKMAEKTGAKK